MTDKEISLLEILSRLEGVIPGFPDTPQKLTNATRAIAKFVGFSPIRHRDGLWTKSGTELPPEEGGGICHEPDDHNRAFCQHCRAQRLVANPAAWLVDQLESRCEWWPSVSEIRRFYCQNFPPVDGVSVGDAIGNSRRAAMSDE